MRRRPRNNAFRGRPGTARSSDLPYSTASFLSSRNAPLGEPSVVVVVLVVLVVVVGAAVVVLVVLVVVVGAAVVVVLVETVVVVGPVVVVVVGPVGGQPFAFGSLAANNASPMFTILLSGPYCTQ